MAEESNKSSTALLIGGAAVLVGAILILGQKKKKVVPVACLEGEKNCNGDFVQECQNGAFNDIEECPFGCQDGQCLAQPTHTECGGIAVNFACIEFPGLGINECVLGEQCTHKECVPGFGICADYPGPGPNTCGDNADCL